ncbi:MAG: DUF1993 domain-containing protein [Gammaproteobacteria bacterium]|jgi:hypothetical protein|nr:DUF1993 domain-containing protein [Gammaproteobacteria bacterium]
MPIAFYDASVSSYLQVLEGVSGVLNKGAGHAAEKGLDLQQFVMTRLHEDMMPLHFQIVSVAHHSWGAIQGMQQGSFSPPSFALDMDYAGLQAVVANARESLASLDATQVETLAGGSMVFKLGKRELPFTNKNFLLSFSLPNFYFHATTTYSILRMLGVPLGKQDYIGQMKMGAGTPG